MKKIPLSEPYFSGNEKKYVLNCLESNWISSLGKYIELFEKQFAEFCEVKHAIAVSNGTAALHLALLSLGIGSGDEVITPTLTYVATVNAITYTGATPIFIDSDKDTWNIDPSKIEEKISSRTKAIIAVHLYGNPADMNSIRVIAKKRNLFIIEDAAEALGGQYRNQMVGSIGNLGTFSFYGNKILTTGEGGMVTTNNNDLASRVRILKGQGQDPKRRYWFSIIGYNYRMTNVQAAMGLGQLEHIDELIKRRRQIAQLYTSFFKDIPNIILSVEKEGVYNVYWLYSICLKENTKLINRDGLMRYLEKHSIETRPFFYPVHTLPPYAKIKRQKLAIAERLSKTGLSLPTSPKLTKKDIEKISKNIIVYLKKVKR